MARLIPSALDAGLPADCMITDLAGVKQKTHEVLREVLHGHTQVLKENRAVIDLPLRELISELQYIHRALESSDQDEAWQWLTAAKDRRDHFVAHT